LKLYPRLGLLAVAVAASLTLAACGGSGDEGAAGVEDGGQDAAETTREETGAQETTAEDTSGASRDGHMDDGHMDGMDHGGHGDMESMLMRDGEYSDELFIDMMVPHHQGAVEMAEVALENAEHQEIRELSEEIIAAQEAEIEELRSIKEREFGTSEVPMEMDEDEMRMMGMMMDPEELANEEPFDLAFIEHMIPHHQSAIEMAEVALEHSENEEILRLAEEIVEEQEREIEQMEAWREEWYPQAA
jgi:uncharacterized protein (DUF305 family)